MSRQILFVLLSIVATAWPGHLMAQDPPVGSETPVAAEPVQENIDLDSPRGSVVERFLKDHRDLWSSPFKAKHSDVKWLIPLGAGTAVLLSRDGNLSDSVRAADGIRPPSRVVSKLGGAAPIAIASGALWSVGKITGNAKAAKTGQMSVEALIHTQLAIVGLKALFNRERPNKFDGQGEFWGGGRSFPSGHAATSFTFATVVARQYKDKPLIQIGAYGLATAVSLSRIGGLNHFPSDVLIGATIGHLIGRFVLNRHKD